MGTYTCADWVTNKWRVNGDTIHGTLYHVEGYNWPHLACCACGKGTKYTCDQKDRENNLAYECRVGGHPLCLPPGTWPCKGYWTHQSGVPAFNDSSSETCRFF